MLRTHYSSLHRHKAAGICLMAALLCIAIGAVLWANTAAKAQSLPTDVQSSCTVSPTMFASWFQTGTPALNGVVNPANSITFPNSPNCSFYQWSKQMFLWLTSPAPSIYGGGSRIFDSPTFYDVSPPDLNGVRQFVRHVPGVFNFGLRAAKNGPNGFPILFDKRGRLLEIHPGKVSEQGKPLVLNQAGKQVEAERITVQNGKAVFLDKANKPIVAARPLLIQKTRKAQAVGKPRIVPKQIANLVTVQKFMIEGKPVLIDSSGTVVESEIGQADGSVLLTQGNGLVYYAIVVNDVFAFYLTGTKNGDIPPPGGNVDNAQFPTTQAQLNPILALATSHGVTIPDGIALAVEVKTSWVEASSVPDKSKYITITGTVPVYNTSSSTTWTQTGTKNVELAMVGMHVVGSTNGHPEMLWATFEHFGNAPNATYQYVSTSGTKTVNQNTSGAWLLTTNGAAAPFNCVFQQADQVSNTNTNIVAANPPVSPGPPPSPQCPTNVAIRPSNIIRFKAFGGAFNQTPNPLDPTTAASNSEILSVDNATQVPGGDVRDQYFMTGSTWTIGGAAPTGMFPSGNEVGTSRLCNTTMETFDQGSSNMATPQDLNCFTCHVTNNVTVSHVFCDPDHGCSAGLQPLFPH